MSGTTGTDTSVERPLPGRITLHGSALTSRQGSYLRTVMCHHGNGVKNLQTKHSIKTVWQLYYLLLMCFTLRHCQQWTWCCQRSSLRTHTWLDNNELQWCRRRGRDSVFGTGHRDRTPVGARCSVPVQIGPGAHPASYTMSTGFLSQG